MIISASRRTDIPAFYAAWFFNRVKEGFVLVPNPRNPQQFRRVSLLPDVVDCFVFWTKNPAPMFNQLLTLTDYPFYFQFTLTAYQAEIEPHLPSIEKRIAIFKQLAEQIGASRIIWRYDPILMNAHYTIDYHVKYFTKIAAALHGYTDTCVISFIDEYRHIRRSLNEKDIRPLSPERILPLCGLLSEISAEYGLKLQTCAEEIDLSSSHITHGACIDKARIERMTGRLLSAKQDKNQRAACHCIESIDIGTYDTCPFGCVYCYATTSTQKVLTNKRLHNTYSPKLVGKPFATDRVKETTLQSLFVLQDELF